MKIIFIRHGRSQAQVDRLVVGQVDSPLSLEGKNKLLEIKEKYNIPETEYYFSSDLSRAIQTIETYFPNKKINKLYPEFREHHLGDFEESDISFMHTEECFEWFKDINIHHQETFSDFTKRIIKGVLKIYHEYGDIECTIGTHAGVIKAFFIYLLNIDRLKYSHMRILNGMAYIFDINIDKNDNIILNNYETLDHQPIFYLEKELEILLLRHGKTEFNINSLICGSSDSLLCEEGINDLKKLKEELDYPEADIYYVTDKIRTRQTLDILYPDVKNVKVNPYLSELDFLKREGEDYIWKELKIQFIDWLEGRYFEFEDVNKFKARLYRGLSEIINDCFINDYKNAVLIYHGIAQKVLMLCLRNEKDLNKALEEIDYNGRGFKISIKVDNEGIKLIKDERF